MLHSLSLFKCEERRWNQGVNYLTNKFCVNQVDHPIFVSLCLCVGVCVLISLLAISIIHFPYHVLFWILGDLTRLFCHFCELSLYRAYIFLYVCSTYVCIQITNTHILHITKLSTPLLSAVLGALIDGIDLRNWHGIYVNIYNCWRDCLWKVADVRETEWEIGLSVIISTHLVH